MTDVLINNFAYIMKVRERAIIGLGALCIALLASYGYFMEKTVVNTVALGKIEASLTVQNQTVSTLSENYMALESRLTLAAAETDGFVPASVSAYVNVPSAGPLLSINAF